MTTEIKPTYEYSLRNCPGGASVRVFQFSEKYRVFPINGTVPMVSGISVQKMTMSAPIVNSTFKAYRTSNTASKQKLGTTAGTYKLENLHTFWFVGKTSYDLIQPDFHFDPFAGHVARFRSFTTQKTDFRETRILSWQSAKQIFTEYLIRPGEYWASKDVGISNDIKFVVLNCARPVFLYLQAANCTKAT
uniref:Capsid protein n=1 Tax=Romanomermis culicivorax TaxID=13658 RepID=A0A915JTN7_ROMCU